jgi:two-component system, NtrC family, sensor kinase
MIVATATLLIVNGPNRGNRFEISSSEEVIIGRSVGCQVRLDDTEVSRHHAAIRHNSTDFVVQDLRSANGTLVNGSPVTEKRLRNGDSVRLGSTQMTFQSIHVTPSAAATGAQIRFVNDSPSGQHSAIVQKVQIDNPAVVSAAGESNSGLELLYQVAEELVTPVHTQDTLLQRILELTINALQADRGCVLLRDPVGTDLTAIAFYRRDSSTTIPAAQMPVSRSITDYVVRTGQAVRTSNAMLDDRFDVGQSIVTSGIREAICAPMRGRSELVGMFYIDTTSAVDAVASVTARPRLTDEHLRAVVTVARQSALSIESRQFQDALVRAERFAAMGQTITVLSHHIKNILQGVRGGSYLIRMGLDQKKDDFIRQGWGIVERNQTRIYDLVMDMLSFSKDRVPALKPAELNTVMREVAELAAARALECSVSFEFRSSEHLPMASFDPEGIHRAVLNIVSNAIDAVSGNENGAVVMQTGYDKTADMMVVAVSDNGPGIPEEQRATIFNVFESSKGSRGTGIGLPVSRKILREHGGRIRIEGDPGEGTRFVLSWPRGNPVNIDSAVTETHSPNNSSGSSVIRSDKTP